MSSEKGVPSIKECISLMDAYGMLDNIRSHSFQVARVAEAVMDGLGRENPRHRLPDLDLVRAGALLHDIAKTPCLGNQCNHAKVGRDICVEIGYPDIGEIVREHVVLYDFSLDRYQRGDFLAKEIVYYADKRVRHDAVVTLEQRLEYILDIYGDSSKKKHELIRKNFKRCQDMETYIFTFIDFSPEELVNHVSPDSIIPDGSGEQAA